MLLKPLVDFPIFGCFYLLYRPNVFCCSETGDEYEYIFFQGVCSSFKFERNIRRTESNYTDEVNVIWLYLFHSTSVDHIVSIKQNFCFSLWHKWLVFELSFPKSDHLWYWQEMELLFYFFDCFIVTSVIIDWSRVYCLGLTDETQFPWWKHRNSQISNHGYH